MQQAGASEQAADVAVACFCPKPAGDPEVVPVTIVLPAPLFGDGLEYLGGSAPVLLGCLRQIAARLVLAWPALEKCLLACWYCSVVTWGSS